MAIALFASGRAEEIFIKGPETLVARSTTIVAGPVSNFSKQVLSTSEPPGPDAMPLKWVIAGHLDNPTVLKGSAPGSVSFSFQEQSLLLPPARDREPWEDDYGEFQSGDRVVLFGGAGKFPTTVLPSGSGDRDLISLVRDIVAIQEGKKGEPNEAWLSYLNDAPLEEGRKAALRTLVQEHIEWNRLAPRLDGLFLNRSFSDAMRSFSFAILVYGLTRDDWKADQASIADFLARQFESEGKPKLLLQYILSLKLVLKYSTGKDDKISGELVTKRITACLKKKEQSVSGIPEMVEQYRQIRSTYPSLLL